MTLSAHIFLLLRAETNLPICSSAKFTIACCTQRKAPPAPHVRHPAFGGLWGAEGQWEEGGLTHVDLAGVHRLVVVDERREFLKVLLRHLQRLVHDAADAHKRLVFCGFRAPAAWLREFSSLK